MRAAPIEGLTYERIMRRKANSKAGFGLSFGVGLVIKVFPFNMREQKLVFHFGFMATYINTSNGEISAVITIPIIFFFQRLLMCYQ